MSKRAPSGLDDAGKALWKALIAFEPDPHEERLVLEACRVVDRLDALAEVIAAEGTMTTNRHGERVSHPALVEARQQQITLARLVAALQIPSDEDAPRTPASRKASKAAATRWGIRDAQRERRADAST